MLAERLRANVFSEIRRKKQGHCNLYEMSPVRATNPRWSRENLAAAVIALLGFFLRFAYLGRKSLWLDEAATYSLCRLPLHEFLRAWWAHEANMTAYYALERVCLHLGSSEWIIRFPSAICGALAVPVMYLLGRRVLSVGAGLLAALLLAVNPAHVEYSQEARSYPMAVLFVLLASLFFVRAVQEQRRRDWAAYVACGALAVYAHFFAALVLAAHFLSLFMRDRGALRWARTLVVFGILGLLAAPAIFFVVFRGGTMDLYWLAPVGVRTFWKLFAFFVGSGVKIAIAVILGSAGLWTLRRFGRWPATFLIGWLFLPIVITFIASLHHNVFSYKYLLICMPALLIICACGAVQMRRELAIALVAILVVASLITDIGSYRKSQEDWRGLNQFVAAAYQPGDAITFYPPYARNPFDYYHERTGPAGLEIAAPTVIGGDLTEDVEDIAHPEKMVTGVKNPRVWVVWYGLSGSTGMANAATEMARALQANYVPGSKRHFANIELQLYEKK